MRDDPVSGATACKHVAQLYDYDERPLISGVARYLAEGLQRGGSLIVVTNDDRRAALFRDLEEYGIAPAFAIRDGRLRVLPAAETLERLYEGGRLSYARFDCVVGGVVREMYEMANGRGLRAYGDMVDELWLRADRNGAMELESYWNRLQGRIRFDLFCAYPREGHGPGAQAIAEAHTHLISA